MSIFFWGGGGCAEKWGAKGYFGPSTFKSAGAMAPAAPPLPRPLLWVYIYFIVCFDIHSFLYSLWENMMKFIMI